nr:ADP-ribosylation factor-like protein [Candidatus Sigynarchaeota archaeon]
MNAAPVDVEKKKILVTGLDNAGKTTLIDLVQNKMVKTLSAQPTRGIARREAEIMGHTIAIHDLGGQEQYRAQYLAQPVKYLDETNAYIFVVDIQDKVRYGVAVGYFEATIGLLDGLGIHPRMFVLFHKFDHAYQVDYNDPRTRVREEFNALKDKFTASAQKYNCTIDEFFKTSIFEEWSCYAAFSAVWSSIITRLESTQAYLDRLAETIPDVILALLLDSQGNLLAKKLAAASLDSAVELVELTNKAINALLAFRSSKIGVSLGETNLVTVNIAGQTVFIRGFESSEKPYYLILAKKAGDDLETRGILNHLTYSLSVFLAASENT